MAFTQIDLDNIEEAIKKIGMSESVASVTIAGKTVQYRESGLSKLLQLRTVIQRELGIAPSTVYAKNMGRSRT